MPRSMAVIPSALELLLEMLLLAIKVANPIFKVITVFNLAAPV